MITQLWLRNFQCHQDLTLDLEPITVLTGQNDAGKSAVLRALRWLALNQWDGSKDEFITWGQEEAYAQVVVDGHTIKRTKGSKENSYTLDEEVFKAFGTKVPDPINRHLALLKDNFQDQQDAAFWLMLNSSSAARALNEIFNLSRIDDAFSLAGSDLRLARTRAKVSKERLKEARTAKKELDWTVKAHKELEQLERMQVELQEKIQALAFLKEQQAKIKETAQRREDIQLLLKLGEQALGVIEQIRKLEQVFNTLQQINKLEEAQCQINQALKRKQEALTELLKICPLCGRSEPTP